MPGAGCEGWMLVIGIDTSVMSHRPQSGTQVKGGCTFYTASHLFYSNSLIAVTSSVRVIGTPFILLNAFASTRYSSLIIFIS